MPRSRQPDPPPLVSKSFTAEEIERGIEKLKRRIVDVRKLLPDGVQYGDARHHEVEFNVRETIREVFGDRSPENANYGAFTIWHGDYNALRGETVQGPFLAGIPQAIKVLEGLIRRLEEKRSDQGIDPVARAKAAFRDLDLHPRIAGVSADLFEDGHYAEAVFSASKALVNLVKEKSSRHDLDGAPLMTTVFSVNAPILAVNELRDQTDRDEQQGTMHLFTGAVLAIRNPGGHGDPNYPPERALEYLGLLSLLAKRVEEAKRRKP